MKDESIKKWYAETFPTDEVGVDINDSVTFGELFEDCGGVYELLGVYDSVIRERVFDKLSEVMDVDYGYIYNKWLYA